MLLLVIYFIVTSQSNKHNILGVIAIIVILVIMTIKIISRNFKSDEVDNNRPKDSGNTVTDINDIVYQFVPIGTQVWMAKNLNVSSYANGDAIPEAKTAEQWEKYGYKKKGCWCYYENKSANGSKYGKLYNWYTVNDSRGLAPKGWHVPSDAEWSKLTDYLGGEDVSGTKMKTTSGWNDYDGESGNGTNSSSFAGLPGGYRGNNGSFYDIGSHGDWWSSTESNPNDALLRNLDCLNGKVNRGYNYKRYGFSVRCLRDL